jgi:ABC-type amino acid transport system permease subunit
MRGYVFQFREVFQEMPMLLDGALTTLHISALTLLFSLVVGILGALCRIVDSYHFLLEVPRKLSLHSGVLNSFIQYHYASFVLR